MNQYRPNVALVLRNRSGKILIGERLDYPGCWQFPQGGQKKGEWPEEALKREAKEELNLSAQAYKILRAFPGYRYDFPKGAGKQDFVGQEQTFFLAELQQENALPEGLIQSPEFRSVRWIQPSEFDADWLPPFKREVYARVWKDLFGLDLAGFQGPEGRR